MRISVLSVELEDAVTKTGKEYQKVVISYKDLGSKKVAGFTLFPFGDKNVFSMAKAAQNGEQYDIHLGKNANDYTEWKSMEKATADKPVPPPSAVEKKVIQEESDKDARIARGAGLKIAQHNLGEGADPLNVMALANHFAKFIATGDEIVGKTASKPRRPEPDLDDMPDDIPF